MLKVVKQGLSVTVNMFEMWNNVSSKLEQVHLSQNQTQQPHTSSGSIKGKWNYFGNPDIAVQQSHYIFTLNTSNNSNTWY